MSDESQDTQVPDQQPQNPSSNDQTSTEQDPVVTVGDAVSMSISERMKIAFKDVSFENYLNDLSSLERTPNDSVFPAHPDLMPKIVDKVKEIYDTAKHVKFEFVDMESLRDDLTLTVDFYKSGPGGNFVEEPDDLIFDIASKLVEIISGVLWLSIYRKHENHIHEARVEKTILDLGFGLRLKRDVTVRIQNGDNFIQIMRDELKYKAFEKILDSFIVREWFMDSFAALNLATIKNYKGRYLFDQGSRHIWIDRGLPTEIFDSDIVIDEWIDQGARVKEQAVFIGNLSSLTTFKISNSAMINRKPIMINSENQVRERSVTEVDPDGDFKPGIHYQVIFKLQLNRLETEKPWIILCLSDKPEPKGK